MTTKTLFVDGDLHSTLEQMLEKLRRSIERLPESTLRAADPEVVEHRQSAEARIEPVALIEGAISVEAEEADIDRRGIPGLDFGFPGDAPTVRGVAVTYTVPFSGDSGLFGLKPSTWTTRAPHAEVRKSELRFTYGVRAADIAETKPSFEQDLALTKQWLGWVNEDVKKYNDRANALIASALKSRYSALHATATGLEALGLPLRSRSGGNVPGPAPKERVSNSPDQGTYDVALSFAGEERAYVDEVARILAQRGLKVFYDEFEKVSLWGKDLVAHLLDIYQNRARYCVVFVSENYVKKPWPNHERKGAQARALYSQEEYLLPVRFDDSALPGLPPTTGYVDLRRTTPHELALLIVSKVT